MRPVEGPRSGGKTDSPLDDAALRALEPVLKSFARRAVSNAAVVDDLVQDTLLAAVTGRDGFDGRSTLRTWVVSILSRKIVDHYRRAQRWADKELEIDDDDLVCAPATNCPERRASDRQTMRALERALVDLPPQERVAIVLCDVEDIDRKEVCNVLAVTATHLRLILHRGRNRLRRALELAGV